MDSTLYLILIALWALFLFGGFFFGRWNNTGTHRIPTPARMISSLILVILAWLWWLTLNGTIFTVLSQLALLTACGMTAGFIGDLFMARLILRSDSATMGGIAAFGIGHLFYIAGFILTASATGLTDPATQWGSLIVLWLIGLILWYIVVLRGSDSPGVLHYAALPYALLLATTAGITVGLALQDSVFTFVAIGAILFLLSDLLLAAQLFNDLHFTGIGDVVWFMYGPGQMLIVSGLIPFALTGTAPG